MQHYFVLQSAFYGRTKSAFGCFAGHQENDAALQPLYFIEWIKRYCSRYLKFHMMEGIFLFLPKLTRMPALMCTDPRLLQQHSTVCR